MVSKGRLLLPGMQKILNCSFCQCSLAFSPCMIAVCRSQLIFPEAGLHVTAVCTDVILLLLMKKMDCRIKLKET